MKEPILSSKPEFSGVWGSGQHWDFHLTEKEPPESSVSVVFCVTFCPHGLVATRTRGEHFEHLGGHREINESLHQTLVREALEEGGAKLSWFRQFGIRVVRSDGDVINKVTNKPYPRPGYLPFYVGFTDEALVSPTGVEVLGSKVFSLQDFRAQSLEAFHERREGELALKFLANLNSSELPAGLRKLIEIR